ncbi:MAG: iron donor protein CyaY [Cellvibrionaceae bacterium]
MNDNDYIEKSEALYAQIEEMIDDMIAEQDVALDYENGGGVLTVLCEDTATQVIITRQKPIHQIWVAAKSGGFHCDYVDGDWYCASTEEELSMLLSRVCSEQSHSAISFATFS